MPYGDYAECPNCGKVAYGEVGIEEEFGYRNMGSGKIIPQSWRRDCRLQELRDADPRMIINVYTKGCSLPKPFFDRTASFFVTFF